MKILRTLLAIGIIVCASGVSVAKHKRPQHIRHVETIPYLFGSGQLSREINQLIQSEDLDADIAVYVKSMHSGEVLYSVNASKPMTPASVLKVLTAEAALIFMGPNYRFSTQVLTDAKSIKNGVLQGNLYILLNGDPTLTYYDLAELLFALKKQQIRAVAGNVYIDNTAYDQRFYGPGWNEDDKGYCYAAPISAGIVDKNCLSFQVAPANTKGSPAKVVRSSKYFYPDIKSTVVTKANTARTCSVHLTNDMGNAIELDGCMPRGRYAWGVSYVITDVPEYNRSLFKDLLRRLSIRVYGKVTFGSAGNQLSLINAHASQPLSLLVLEMLKKSDNVIAGALFKKLGQLYFNQPGSWENGSLAVSRILTQHAGVRTNAMRILDGSGLSSDNLVTASQIMQVLNYAYRNQTVGNSFITALPISGVDGTLKNRLTNVTRKIRAKTGTISGVVSLAGYAVGAKKETLGFVIMVNGSKGKTWRYRALEDKIVTALTQFYR